MQHSKPGYAMRYPNGELHCIVFSTVEAAQSNAAFCMSHTSSCELPKDWDAAYKEGYRVVPAVVHSTGGTRPSWKTWVRSW